MRRCSICNRSGHTKRSCKDSRSKSEVFVESPKISPLPKNTERPIVVHVHKDAALSEHVLKLKNNAEAEVWKNIPVFQEKKEALVKQVAVDLASLVRAANENTKEYNNKKSAHQYFSDIPKIQKPFFTRKEKIKQQLAPTLDREMHHIPKKNRRTFGETCSDWIEDMSTHTSRAFSSRRFWIVVTTCLLLVATPFPAYAYYKQLKSTSATVVEQSTSGFLALQSSTVAAFNSNIPDAQSNLNRALESFSHAESLVDNEHQILQYIAGILPFIGTEIESRRHILSAGHHVALGNTYVLKGIEETEKDNNPHITDRFYNLREHFRFAIPQYKEALTDLASVDPNVIPSEYQKSFQDFKLLFTAFVDDTQNMIDFIDTMQHVFGSDDFKRYLIVFQNNRELRSTGGFMGSFAILDVQKGKILGLSVPPGGTYDVKGQLDVHVKPPTPLLLLNNRWEFQDSNWWPDFPASAEKMAWFYQHARGTSVDGVIAINATVFEKLLSAIGPLKNEKHDVVLDAATALDSLQYKVEVDYDTVSNTPKAIIGDIALQLLTELPKHDSADALKLLVALHDSLQNKEIQAYFFDPNTENTMEQFGWSGQIVNTQANQDYLFAVNTNIQGQKSDGKIKQEIEHQSEVQEDGSVLDTVVIRRTHTGTVGEMFSGNPNISYLRLYVPIGAVLVDAGGFSSIKEESFRSPETWAKDDSDLSQKEKNRKFDSKTGTEIYTSFGKTVFGNWVVTDPGQTSEVFVTYRIPNLVNMNDEKQVPPHKWQTAFFGDKSSTASRYSLVVQKQSGVDSDFTSTVIYPDVWHPVWKSRDDIDLAMNGGIFKTILDKDEIYGVVMEK